VQIQLWSYMCFKISYGCFATTAARCICNETSAMSHVGKIHGKNTCLPCCAMPCHAVLNYAMPCHAMPCCVMPCCVMPCCAMPCHGMLCYSTLGHAMPCHTMQAVSLGAARTKHADMATAYPACYSDCTPFHAAHAGRTNPLSVPSFCLRNIIHKGSIWFVSR